MKLIHSLRFKLTITFLFLITAIAGMAMFYVLKEASRSLKDVTRDELEAIAAVISTQIDADKLLSLKPGDEATPEYQAIKNQLIKIQLSHPDIKYIYTMKRVGRQVQFLVDPEFGNTKDPGAAIGERYAESTKSMFQGFAVISSEPEPAWDKWGYLVTGYAPISDSKGRHIALVGVDMTGDRLINRQKFIGNTVYLILGLAGILAGLIVLLISATIIKDINKLNQAAEKISRGDMEVTVDVKRKDEIGQLADSFSRMIASLKIMMMGDK
jgi:HAMP domain-containing protein